MGVPPTQVWTREQVATRILNGDTLFVLNNNLVRVPPSWLAAHPGGTLAILHYVGRDATDEVEAFHSDETLQKMKGFVIGRVEPGEDGWIIASIPQVPGAISQGHTREEARTNVIDALRLMLKPEPGDPASDSEPLQLTIAA